MSVTSTRDLRRPCLAMRLTRSPAETTARRASGRTTPAGIGASVITMGPAFSGSGLRRARSAHSGVGGMAFSGALESDSTMATCSSVSESSSEWRASGSGTANTVTMPECENAWSRRVSRAPPATSVGWVRSSAVAAPPTRMRETNVRRWRAPKSRRAGGMYSPASVSCGTRASRAAGATSS